MTLGGLHFVVMKMATVLTLLFFGCFLKIYRTLPPINVLLENYFGTCLWHVKTQYSTVVY
jgi:hypothetical protein